MMNPIITIIFLSMLPVAELRGAIPYAVIKGFSPWSAYLLSVIPNILVIFVVLFFLDYLHKYFMKISVYRRLFLFYIRRVQRKAEQKIRLWQFFALFLFVAVPFPGTGAYTGCLITWFFNLDRKKAIPTMMLAVVSAGVVVTLASFGIFSFLS